jgi:Ca-activated chloride channel family protein
MSDPEPTRILPSGIGNSNQFSDTTQSMRTVGLSPASVLVPTLVLDCEAGNHYVQAGVPTKLPLLFTVRPSQHGAAVRMPLNVCICLDRSGSMEGQPLEYAKIACDHVVDLLEPSDTLAIVTFSEQADIVMPARRVVNKAVIKDYIHRIVVGNTTNIFDGLTAAGSQVDSAKTIGTLNRILLLTDGEPTAGTRDFSTIIRYVSEQKQRGITVTALGFGPDYNEELVAGIARRSGGNYYYISRPELLPEMFRRELDGMMRTVARNITVKVGLPRDVSVVQVHGKEIKKLDERTFEVPLPDAESGANITALWELEIARHRAGIFRIARAELAYEESISGRRTGGAIDVPVEFTLDTALIAAGKNSNVEAELSVANMARDLDRTLMLGKTQALSTQTVLDDMYRTQTLLVQQGRTMAAEQIHEAMTGIRNGDSVEKTLMGTIYQLESGKNSASDA